VVLNIRAEYRRGNVSGEAYDGKLDVRLDEGVLETDPGNGLTGARAKAAGSPLLPVPVVAAPAPYSADRERHGLLARGVERASESRPAGSLSTAGQGRHGADREAGGMAGARVSQCGGELAGRFGRDVHRESFGFVANSFSLPGLDQRDREPAQRSPPAH